jgi:hypothetical protein
VLSENDKILAHKVFMLDMRRLYGTLMDWALKKPDDPRYKTWIKDKLTDRWAQDEARYHRKLKIKKYWWVFGVTVHAFNNN